MKTKFVVALGAGCAVALVVVPPMFIKSQVDANLAELQQTYNAYPQQQLTLEKQEDGWFGASYTGRAVVNVSDIDPNLGDLVGSQVEVPFTLETSYGPLLFGNGFDIGLSKSTVNVQGDTLPDIIAWEKEQPIYRVSMTTGLLGGHAVSDQLMPFTISDEDGQGNLEFSGYEGHGSFSDDGFDYQGESESLSISDQGEVFQLAGYAFEIDSDTPLKTLMDTGIAEYDMTMTLDQASLTDLFSVRDIKLNSESNMDEDAGTTGGAMHVSMNALEVTDYPTIQSFTTDIVLDNVSIEFLEQFNAYTQELASLPDYQQQRLLTEFFVEHAALLVESEPMVALQGLDVAFEEGDVHLSARGSLHKIAQMDAATLNSPNSLKMIHANAEFEIDEALMDTLVGTYVQQQLKPQLANGWITQEQYEMHAEQMSHDMIESFVTQGWLVKDGDQYQANFELEEGVAAFNDQQIKL